MFKLTPQLDHNGQTGLVSFCHIQTMKSTINGAMPINMGAMVLHILLSRCIDHPAEVALVVVDAAEVEVVDVLLLEPVEPVGVVPVGLVAVGSKVVALKVGVPSVKAAVVIGSAFERDVAVNGESGMDADDDELPEPVADIWVMAKAGLVSPESPNTRSV